MEISFLHGRGDRKGGEMEINRVGILGAGTMGSGIAQVIA